MNIIIIIISKIWQNYMQCETSPNFANIDLMLVRSSVGLEFVGYGPITHLWPTVDGTAEPNFKLILESADRVWRLSLEALIIEKKLIAGTVGFFIFPPQVLHGREKCRKN